MSGCITRPKKRTCTTCHERRDIEAFPYVGIDNVRRSICVVCEPLFRPHELDSFQTWLRSLAS